MRVEPFTSQRQILCIRSGSHEVFVAAKITFIIKDDTHFKWSLPWERYRCLCDITKGQFQKTPVLAHTLSKVTDRTDHGSRTLNLRVNLHSTGTLNSNQKALTYLVLSCHRSQVVLQPAILSDCDLFVSLQGIQLILTGVQLPPQTDDLPLAALQRPLQLPTRITV